ncbi:hypothetical protein [Alloprevotella tannerae]|uniref:hypothetical protein n=1 Tax=Alloprevotella tannerae TaxID=76122 RepID=UPI0025EB1395|nr:hypothetical protein [Alloprevotella tannerae]
MNSQQTSLCQNEDIIGFNNKSDAYKNYLKAYYKYHSSDYMLQKALQWIASKYKQALLAEK